MEQNKDFQKVFDYERMVELTLLPPEQMPADAKLVYMKDTMRLQAKSSLPSLSTRIPTWSWDIGYLLEVISITS